MPAPISRRPIGGRSASGCCAACSPACCRIAGASARRRASPALGQPSRRLLAPLPQGERLAAMLDLAPTRTAAALADDASPALFAAKGQRRGPRRAAHRLRAAGAGARRSTRRRSACSPATASRWCCAQGEGCCGALVHHMGRRRARSPSPAATSTPGPRDRRRRPRRHPHHRLGLRHDDQGLRLHAARRPRLCRARPPRVSALAKDVAEYLAGAHARRWCARPARPSPITPPARCSTARRSRPSRRRC